MGTKIYLGQPPAGIRQWMIDHATPAVNMKTRIVYANGSETEILIEGSLDSGDIPNIQNVV